MIHTPPMKKFLMAGLFATTALISSAQSPVYDAMRLTENEQFEKASAAFKRILSTDPQNGDAWFQLGENYFANDRLDSASYCYDKVPSANPLGSVGKGKMLWVNGKAAEAKTLFEGACAAACDKGNKLPKNVQAQVYREVAEALVAGDKPDAMAALVYADRAIELDPKDPNAYITKGDVLKVKGGFDSQPVESYKKAMELAPSSPKPIVRRGWLYFSARNSSAASEDFSNAINLDANYAPAYRGRAEAKLLLSDYEGAVADYEKYLSLNQGSVSARVRYVQFLYLVKRYDQSLQVIGQLESEGVKQNILNRIKGYDQAEKEDFAGAKATMDQYFVEQPADKVISQDHEYVARIQQGLGKAATAAGVSSAVNDSLAGLSYMAAARMEKDMKHRGELYMEASKAFSKAKDHDLAINAIKEKQAVMGRAETNDWYYMGKAANSAKRFGLADSCWAEYIIKQPEIYNGYLFRARAQAGMDTAQVKTWQAKPYYDQVLLKMKPEEMAKSKNELEEAYNYMGVYFLYNKEVKDLGKAKCYFEKVRALAAGTGITKQVESLLSTKELKDVTASTCEQQL